MQTTEEIVEFIKEHAELSREDLLANNFSPKVTFQTEDGFTRLALFPHMDGTSAAYDKFAYAVRLLSAGIDDLAQITFVVDTYNAKQMTKHDGTEWGPGGMQYAWVNNTVDKDLLTEAFTYQVADKSGIFAMVSVPYTKSDEDVEFHWDDIQTLVSGDGGKAGGFFPNAMREALVQTKLLDQMLADGHSPEEVGLDMEAGRIHTLAVAVKLCMRQTEWPCLIPARNEREAEIIKESMDGGPFSEGIRMYDQDDIEEISELDKLYERS